MHLHACRFACDKDWLMERVFILFLFFCVCLSAGGDEQTAKRDKRIIISGALKINCLLFFVFVYLCLSLSVYLCSIS